MSRARAGARGEARFQLLEPVGRGVDFGSMDGEPATLIFLILVPEAGGEDHLAILSSLRGR